jgi:hypothetical protein
MVDLPIPKDVKHQRFAAFVANGHSLVDSYLAAGYKCKRESALQNAKRLRKTNEVDAYIRAVQKEAADADVMDVREKRVFLARIVRTPITSLDPDKEEDADLIKSYSETTGEMSSSKRLEKLDPLKAIELDNKLAGVGDPEADAVQSLAEAIASLAPTSPIPTDRM